MSKHIQPISHYPPHERIKTFLIKKILKQQSVKVSGIIVWLLYETSECYNKSVSMPL